MATADLFAIVLFVVLLVAVPILGVFALSRERIRGVPGWPKDHRIRHWLVRGLLALALLDGVALILTLTLA